MTPSFKTARLVFMPLSCTYHSLIVARTSCIKELATTRVRACSILAYILWQAMYLKTYCNLKSKGLKSELPESQFSLFMKKGNIFGARCVWFCPNAQVQNSAGISSLVLKQDMVKFLYNGFKNWFLVHSGPTNQTMPWHRFCNLF